MGGVGESSVALHRDDGGDADEGGVICVLVWADKFRQFIGKLCYDAKGMPRCACQCYNN